ncbi:proline-rich transmembrane protein 3-like [Leucoraja erinacea]|uniref:proline-rich transmembrane protein 3-like n=1 Tax=Leucoraja erinaceus TaxID=7782 RepID=UPI002457EDBE|nr:proline-rich transmembrane protein 3-like [Leucoraja erinacea]XP_055504108.1 proline-rich transmembrane protein 3-like [Leucoraja erinacea]
MAMLKTGPTALAQGLSAKVSNKVNVSATQTPLVQEGPGTKSVGTNPTPPWATTKVPFPSSRPTKMPEAWTSTKGGPVKADVTPPLNGAATERTSSRATGTPGIHYTIVTTGKGGHSGTATQTPTMTVASNTTAGVNTTSPKGQGPRNGPGHKRIMPINGHKPNHTADARTTVGSRSNKISPRFELCPTQDRDCAANTTFTQWKDMKRTLGFAWELHIYGAGVLFVILMVISLINLIGSPILYIPDLGYLMAAHAVLFVLAFLRALYLFLDPYGSKAKLPLVSGLVLYNITFPLLVTTFGILTLLLLKMGSLQMLSSKLQSPTTLSTIASAHFVVLISGDLLCLLVNPAVNVVLHVFSVSWASFLFTAFFLSYRKLKSRPETSLQPIPKSAIGNEEPLDQQIQGRALKQLLISTRVMAIAAVLGFLCCALQVYATLWNYGLLGKKGQFYWTWWFLQFWYRSFEIAMSIAMSFVASYTFCQQHTRPGHTCWRKIVQYFHHYRKSEVRDYPNNCFDWSYGTQDRVTSNNICKNLLRNQSESMPLKAMNGTNGAKPAKSYLSSNGSILSLDHRPKIPVLGPKSHNLLIGRSFTSICIEKESAVSLTELDLRPPSPINLSRSIDEALFREHIVRDSLFNNSSLRQASHLALEGSRSSFRVTKASDQTNATRAPLGFRRRNSDPDCLYNMAKSGSLNNHQMDTSKQSVQELDSTQASSRLHRSASGSSLDSISRTSFGIHWYTWTRERSSEESVPSADPASESLLSQDKSLDNPDVTLKSEDLDLEAQKSFIEIRVIDDVSLTSDTIEL